MESTTTAAAGLVVERTNLERIEGFFKSSSYRESLEMSASFNSRLTLERKLRIPFLDPQTGAAQRNCSLKARQRMPGLRHGQIYTFPALRWRKSKRQYLNTLLSDCQFAASAMSSLNSSGFSTGTGVCTNSGSIITGTGTAGGGGGGGSTSGGYLVSQNDDNSNSNASFMLEKFQAEALLDGDTNSRDTNNNSKEELSKDWLYDDLDNDFDTFSEPKSADDEYDYDPRYGSKKRLKKASKKEAKPKKASSTATSFGGFDFNEMRSSMKSRRSKDATQTPKKTGDGGAGSSAGVGRPRRKGAGTTGGGGGKKKKFVEPPSFESAAAAMDNNFSSGSGW